MSSVENVRRSCSLLLRWICTLVGADGEYPLASSKDLTPFHLVQFQRFAEQRLAETSLMSYYGRVCMLMDFLPTSPAVRLQSRKRRASKTRNPVRPVERYEQSEFLAIQRAARNVVRAAHRRVTDAYREALQGDQESATAKQRALWEIVQFGEPQSLAHWQAIGAWKSKYRNRAIARSSLFIDSSESLAAAVLIACRSGMNLSAVSSMTVPTLMAHSISQSDVDKPRRGPANRFWGDITDDRGEDKGASSAVQMIAEMTAPLRDHLRIAGSPTERLLVWWGTAVGPRFGAAYRHNPTWAPTASGTISFNRIRRSAQSGGVGRAPTHHAPSVHLRYVRSDPASLEDQQVAAAAGVQAALDRARSQLTMVRGDEQATPRDNDALIAHCADPDRSPITGLPCTAGYFSFLDCLDCDNALTVDRLLPRQMAALQVIEQMRDAVGDQWDERYRHRALLLRALVERSTPAERERAAPHVASFSPLIIAALRHEVPESYEHFSNTVL
ncbi:hypothetical protein [Microbacterium sp. KSW4-4]|uniref:hypothetical protein n=1 Tax=Microbacterium sp. KSW4-4 TaxID=2851651 RepID=UPI001FFD6E1E|nr:hypothetical protein [Microbacterium sp. KSW4-4]MCK2032212.1 hypothetical protein [Microbacterium sp. KSW4-4]